jgi:tetratricopeptide (TPR) repeat protein
VLRTVAAPMPSDGKGCFQSALKALAWLRDTAQLGFGFVWAGGQMFRHLVILFALSLGAAVARAEPEIDCARASDPNLRIKGCTNIISRDPTAPDAFRNRGEAYFAKGDHNRAVRDFSKAIELDPRDAASYLNRGLVFATRNDHDQAISDLTRAIQLQPTAVADAYDTRGVVYLRKGDHDRAMADFNRALEFRPRFARTHFNRGLAYQVRGDLDEAIKDFTKAIEFDPRLAVAYLHRGMAYESYVRARCAVGSRRVGESPPPCVLSEKYDRILLEYSKAIELDPTNALAYYGRGLGYWKIGDYNRAIADTTKAIELDPKGAQNYNGRGLAYHMKGAYELAISDYSKAIELDPTSGTAYVNRGEAWEDSGRIERATADYRAALALPAMRETHQGAQSALDRIARGLPTTPRPNVAPPTVPKTPYSGTGFIVSNDGAILTNAHVVPNCATIQINRPGSASALARLVATDRTNDVALLRPETVPTSSNRAPFRSTARVGESVFAYGFPLAGFLPTSGNFTSGNITANAGLVDDSSKLQFSAPIQPGNSGGPLLDKSGNIVGVVVATLDALKFADATNKLPQNINFAIKASVAIEFLQSHGVTVNLVVHDQHLAPEDVADRAAAMSVHIVCN